MDAPESQYPRVGEDYLVKCKAQGNPSPLVYWNKNGESILSGDRYIVQNDGLLIQKVRESDDGMYKCSAYVMLTGHVKMRDIKVRKSLIKVFLFNIMCGFYKSSSYVAVINRQPV